MEGWEIVKLIKGYEKLYDRGSNISMLKSIYYHLFGTYKTEIDSINEFLIKEACTNENNQRSICLHILVFSKQENLASELEKCYRSYADLNDDNWKEEFIMAMFNLNYTKPTDLYYEYISSRLQNKSANRDDFFVLVNYVKGNEVNGIRFISEYYAERLLSTSSFVYNDEWRLGYFIQHFIENHAEIFIEIIKETNKKNVIAGNLLKIMVINYLKTKYIDNDNKVIINNLIKNIEAL